MIMVAILLIVILTTLAVSIGTQPRTTGLDSETTSGSTLVVGPRVRRRGRRGAGSAHVRPQYLPSVARARILRAQVPRVGVGEAQRRETV
jgi:hypothetical protein